MDQVRRVKSHPIGAKRNAGGGYVRIKIKDRSDGWRSEHIHVIEQSIGRPLLPTETVHHKNGERDDNRLENLELMDSSHPAGQRVSDKLAWCHAFIERYRGMQLSFEIASESLGQVTR